MGFLDEFQQAEGQLLREADRLLGSRVQAEAVVEEMRSALVQVAMLEAAGADQVHRGFIEEVTKRCRRRILLAKFEEAKGHLSSYVARLMGDSEPVEDVLQEIWIAAQTKEAHIELDRLPAWFFTVAAHNCANRRRSRARHREAQVPAVGEDKVLSGPQLGPLDELIASEGNERLRACIEQLPEILRKPLTLYYMEDVTVQHIGDRLGYSKQTASARILAARAELKSCLAGPEEAHQ